MYVKIFAGILKSSIAAETPLRRFFMDLLLIADRDGYVIATRDAIAKDLGVDRAEVDWGLDKLMQPDPESGNPDNEGRRIEPVDGRGYGWRILNYGFYRDLKTSEDLRAAHARRQDEYRKRKAARDISDNHVTPQAHAQTQNSESISKAKQEPKKERARKRAALTPLPETFELSDRVIAWAEGYGYGRLAEHLEHFISTAKARAYVYADWDSALMNAIRKDWAGIRAPGQSQTIKPAMGKTAQAMHTLEGMKNGHKRSDPESNATLALSGTGRPAGG